MALLRLLRFSTQGIEGNHGCREPASRDQGAIGQLFEQELLAQAPRLELDCLLCWPIKRIGIVLQALPGPSEVCCLLLEHRSRVLTDRGIEFETSTFQQAFEPKIGRASGRERVWKAV